MGDWLNRTHVGDCRALLRQMATDGVRVQTCITSPPYYGLRDYGMPDQIGLELTPAAYVEQMVEVFDLVRNVLADDGTLWLNLGDSYAGSWGAQSREHAGKHAPNVSAMSANQIIAAQRKASRTGSIPPGSGLKPKDLMGIPWRVAFALQEAGWWLRQDIIWHKPNPMPESVRDRCTKAHEYLFLLAKSERYYWDSEAMQERATAADVGAMDGGAQRMPDGSNANEGRNFRPGRSGNNVRKPASERDCPRDGVAGSVPREGFSRNRRSVWSVTTKPFSGAHFATFPPDLIQPCVLAGAPAGGVVLDPFMGSGTTAQVALGLGRQFIGCELNPEYAALLDTHRAQQRGMAL